MKKNIETYKIEESFLYKTNMKIHRRLLSVYSFLLAISIVIVLFSELA